MKDYEVFRQWLGGVMDVIYGPSHNWPFKALEKEMKKPTVKYAGNIGKEGMYTNKKPKRARGPKGRYKGDDKSTPNVNEAWVGGKAPKKGKKK